MLEEALSSTTYSPAEAALTFISFLEVELVAGGAAAESRFFKLFSMLCDRVFGELSNDEGFKHKVGGWLSRHVRWERPNSSISSNSSSSHYRIPHRPGAASSSIRTDPVIKLLGARDGASASTPRDPQQPLTLIEAFAKEAEHRPNVRYPFPFGAFPKPTQDAWLALIDMALGSASPQGFIPSENATRLLDNLFRVKPLEQISLRQHQQAKTEEKDYLRPLQLSPIQFQSRQPLSPMAVHGSTPSKEKDTLPMISLSMLEYYLVIFIRYPLAPPPSQPQPGPTKQVRPGVPLPSNQRSEPYGDTVYYQLFQEYTDYYIQNTLPQGQSNGFAALQRPSELFVRIIVELWLEGQNSLLPTTLAVKGFTERPGGKSQLDLNSSFDLVKTKYSPPPSQVTRCLHKLVARAVADGAILDLSKDIYSGYKGAKPEILCLTPTMTILQLPFFNYIRSAFRHASIHAKESPFYAALTDWLVWLEPWNTRYERPRLQQQRLMDTVSRSGNTLEASGQCKVTYPRANQRSLYQEHWEPYIASNLYVYVVPLALFLRRSRELDFSPREFQRSLNTVRRVFRVFSPEVVAVINKLLKREPDCKWTGILLRHERNLESHMPPPFELGLQSCQSDMQNLLEEIYLQHLKKINEMDFFDRSIAYIEGFFGGGAYAGEEKELHLLSQQAKSIVAFPSDFEVLSSLSSFNYDLQGVTSSNDAAVDRVSNGYFSQTGIEKFSRGIAKCNPLEIGYVGDRMLCRPRSHEIAFIIPILVKVSVWLNSSLGLQTYVSDDNSSSLIPRRFNLRFLADYRNLVSIAFGYLCFKLIKG